MADFGVKFLFKFYQDVLSDLGGILFLESFSKITDLNLREYLWRILQPERLRLFTKISDNIHESFNSLFLY